MKEIKYIVVKKGRTVLITTHTCEHNLGEMIWEKVKELKEKYDGSEVYIKFE